MQGHSPDERKTVPGKKNVMVLEVQPVGNYAVRLVFDDMHSTGIFSWDYFVDLGRNYEILRVCIKCFAAGGPIQAPLHVLQHMMRQHALDAQPRF